MSYAQTGICLAEKNCPSFSNVWRWHLAIQNIKTTGKLGCSVKFNKPGWETYRIWVQVALKTLRHEVE